MSKSNYIFNIIFTILLVTLAVNIGIAIYNIQSSKHSQNSLTRAGLLIDSIRDKVNQDGYIFYESDDIDILIMNKKWYEKNFMLEVKPDSKVNKIKK